MYKYISEDGLAKSNDKSFVDLWNKIVNESKEKQTTFIQDLINKGIKALHADDGWVDRENNIVKFCYPDFKFDINVGDKIALGDYKKFRICRITEIIEDRIFVIDKYRYKFEEIKQ